MHCDRCNVDFPEGLRYCKWCGEALVDRPRVTSELHSCPNCLAAIQPGWTFCKACGERLNTVPRTPTRACPSCGAETEANAPKCLRCGELLTIGLGDKVPSDSAGTSVIAMCSSCGERLDANSLYCKGCGSAVYTEPTPFGGSALLCGACNSYSPLGSRLCRVCGASLGMASQTVVDFPAAAPTIQQKPPTLPDLDEQIAGRAALAEPESEPVIKSGANTLTFTGVEQQTDDSHPRGPIDTNLLPGTAGSKSEQQSPTSVMHMSRITGPVEADEGQEAPSASGDLASAPGNYVEPAAIQDPRGGNIEPTVEFSDTSQPQTSPRPSTFGLGSESESESVLVGPENKTAVFVSRPQQAPPASHEQDSRDDRGTRQITPVPPTPGLEPTKEFQRPARRVTADHVASTDFIASVPESTSDGPDILTYLTTHSEPFDQIAPQPLPTKRTGMVIATVVVVILMLAAAGYVAWLLFGRGKPNPPAPPPVAVEQPTVTPQPPVPEKPPLPVLPEGMVAVAGGAYTIGRDGADPLEQPEHKVDVPAFLIDRSEVTNAAYKTFVDATAHKPPSNWTGTSFPEGRENFPVTGVTWQDAADYARWAGKRLPTEAEWEAAARGTDGRIYPWGNGFRSGVANIGLKPDKPTSDQYPAGIKETGRYPDGASPAGAVDMIGNAWEWVADEINVYPGNSESKLDLESGVTYRVIRGGAYDGSKVNDATYRGYLDGSQAYPKVGFRCAKDAK